MGIPRPSGDYVAPDKNQYNYLFIEISKIGKCLTNAVDIYHCRGKLALMSGRNLINRQPRKCQKSARKSRQNDTVEDQVFENGHLAFSCIKVHATLQHATFQHATFWKVKMVH
jgi:hypothetical protein